MRSYYCPQQRSFPPAGRRRRLCGYTLMQEAGGGAFFFGWGQQCVMGKEQTKQEGGKEESGSKRRCGIFCSSRKPGSFLFLSFRSPPFFFLRWGLSKKERRSLFPKKKKRKRLTKRKVHVQNSSIIPSRSRVPRFGLEVSSKVSMCRHNSITRSQHVDQSDRREYKQEPFFLLPTSAKRKEERNKKKRLDTSARTFPLPLLSFFCPPLDSLPFKADFPPPSS